MSRYSHQQLHRRKYGNLTKRQIESGWWKKDATYQDYLWYRKTFPEKVSRNVIDRKGRHITYGELDSLVQQESEQKPIYYYRGRPPKTPVISGTPKQVKKQLSRLVEEGKLRKSTRAELARRMPELKNKVSIDVKRGQMTGSVDRMKKEVENRIKVMRRR